MHNAVRNCSSVDISEYWCWSKEPSTLDASRGAIGFTTGHGGFSFVVYGNWTRRSQGIWKVLHVSWVCRARTWAAMTTKMRADGKMVQGWLWACWARACKSGWWPVNLSIDRVECRYGMMPFYLLNDLFSSCFVMFYEDHLTAHDELWKCLLPTLCRDLASMLCYYHSWYYQRWTVLYLEDGKCLSKSRLLSEHLMQMQSAFEWEQYWS